MNKDIIYIDTEDDITAIIGKIKSSSEKIVALVPPKRTGLLQSAVNLRLLARMATKSSKHLVIITNNKALIALSASAKIPVAKNLQSKPEIAEIAALEIDDGEDIIDGAQLPIGELVKTTDYTKVEDIADDIGTLNIDDDKTRYVPPSISKDSSSKPQPINGPEKSKIKVPDFLSFRKKFFLGITGFILLIVFLVWANIYAPAARIIINTKTEIAPISMILKLGGAASTDIDKNIVQTITKQIKKDVSVEFTATGKEKRGTKATGTMTLSNALKSATIYVPAGSVFSNGTLDFTTKVEVYVPGATVDEGIVPGTINVDVVAAEVGSEYNLAANSYDSSVSWVTASGTAMTGGESHDAIVVTQEDIDKATQAITELPSNDVKTQLTKQFTNGETVIKDSFVAERAKAVSVPELDAEVTGTTKAKLTIPTTFTMTAIAKSELQSFLKNSLNKQIDKDQRIYDDGFSKVVLSGYTKNDTESTVNVATNGKIGPNIDKTTVMNQVKGKRFGDIQALLEGIKGVSSVDVKFSYFWVRTVPNDIKKIEVDLVSTDV